MEVRDLGLIAYADAMRLQDELVEQRLEKRISDTLLLLEHPPVITLGRRGSLSDVYLVEGELRARGIAVERTTRGGLVTYHGPGQLVGYPIVNVRQLGLTLPCYVRALEEAIVDTLSTFGIHSYVDDDHIGVWTEHGKIAAIGVAQRHGVTLHGFAINLHPNMQHFALINPCGIGALGVTSAEALLGERVDIAAFKPAIAHAVCSRLTEKAFTESDCPVATPEPRHPLRVPSPG